VENAAYTVGLCAERTAAVKAVSEGYQRFKAIAIASKIDQHFIGPCGSCRQFLAEFGLDLVLYLTKPDGSYDTVTLKQLLPMTFTAEQLNSCRS
jgi:cytidine deaminase